MKFGKLSSRRRIWKHLEARARQWRQRGGWFGSRSMLEGVTGSRWRRRRRSRERRRVMAEGGRRGRWYGGRTPERSGLVWVGRGRVFHLGNRKHRSPIPSSLKWTINALAFDLFLINWAVIALCTEHAKRSTLTMTQWAHSFLCTYIIPACEAKYNLYTY